MPNVQLDYTGTDDVWLPEGGIRLAASTANQAFDEDVYLDSEANRDVLNDLLRRALISWDTIPTGYALSTNDAGESILVKGGTVKTYWDTTRATSAADTAANIDKAAVAAQKHYVTAIEVGVSAGSAVVELTEDPAGTPNVLWRGRVAAAGPLCNP